MSKNIYPEHDPIARDIVTVWKYMREHGGSVDAQNTVIHLWCFPELSEEEFDASGAEYWEPNAYEEEGTTGYLCFMSGKDEDNNAAVRKAALWIRLRRMQAQMDELIEKIIDQPPIITYSPDERKGTE